MQLLAIGTYNSSMCISQNERVVLHMYGVPLLEQLFNAKNIAFHVSHIINIRNVPFLTIILTYFYLPFTFN